MKRKGLSILLAIVMIFGTIIPAMATQDEIATHGIKNPISSKIERPEKNKQNILQKQVNMAIMEQGVKNQSSSKMVELLLVADGSDITKDLEKIGAMVDRKSTSVYVVNIPANKATEIAKLKEIKAIGRDHILSLPKPIQKKDFSMNSIIAHPHLEFGNQITGIVEFWRKGYDGKGMVVSIIDTGVEPGNEMLTLTTDGKIKIIDWQDFWHHSGEDSEGDVRLGEKQVYTEENEKFIQVGQRKIYLPNTVGDNVLYGNFDENNLDYFNTKHDVNNNGKRDDKFTVVVDYDPSKDLSEAIIYVDTNLNDDLRDEKPMGVYKEIVKSWKDQIIFEMEGQNPILENDKPKVKEAFQEDYAKLVNHFYNQQKGTNYAGTGYYFVISRLGEVNGQWIVNLGYDGNSHGTHVAGDAAGNGYVVLPFVDTEIKDEYGNTVSDGTLKGAAPGAQIIACRVFQSDGGTPASAYMAAMEYSAENGAHIVNMSLGSLPDINDGNEPSAILAGELGRKYGTIFVISAGNSGPVTNAIGVPGASKWAITVGAYNPAWLNYGYRTVEDNLWYFSSRGPTEDGRIKPEIIAPGSMISAMPMWYVDNIRQNEVGGGVYVGYALEQGTSMSSPYAAGTIAAIMQAMREKELPFHPLLIKEALFETGDKELENKKYLPTEIGGGMIQPNAALDYLEELKEKGLKQGDLKIGAEYIDRYDIILQTEFDYTEKLDYKPEGLYVRSGDIPQEVTITITNTKNEDVNLVFEKDSYGFLNEWIILPQNTMDLAKGESKTLVLSIDKDKLKQGVNSMLIHMNDENTLLKEGFIPITIVNYMDLNVQNPVQTESESRNIKPGETDSHFIRIPYGTQRAEIVVELTDMMDASNLLPMVAAPTGIQDHNVPGVDWIYTFNRRATLTLIHPEPGTWEVAIFSGLINDYAAAKGKHTVTAKLRGVSFGPSIVNYQGRSGEYMEEELELKLLNATNNDVEKIYLTKTTMASINANRKVERMTIEDGAKNIVKFTIPENDKNLFVNIKTGNIDNTEDDIDLVLYRVMTDAQGNEQLGSVIAQSENSDSNEEIYVEGLRGGRYAIVVDAYNTANVTTYDLMYQVVNNSHGINAIDLKQQEIVLTRELEQIKMGVRVPIKPGKHIGFINATDKDGNILGRAKVEALALGTENSLILKLDEILRYEKNYIMKLQGEIKEPNNLNSIYGVQFVLNYDPEKISAEEILKGDIFQGTDAKEIKRSIQEDKIIFVVGFMNISMEQNAMGAMGGNIAKIKMNAKALGNTTLAFEKLLVVNHRGDEIALNVVKEYDTNIASPHILGNESFDIRDMAKMAYLVGTMQGEEGYEEVLDFNKDGVIDYKDFNFLIECFREDY